MHTNVPGAVEPVPAINIPAAEHGAVRHLPADRRRRSCSRERRAALMCLQRLAGLALLLASALVVVMASRGQSVEERDITAVFFLLPLGLYALTTKAYILNIPLCVYTHTHMERGRTN